MSLPSLWVDKLFYRLMVVYGSHFTGRWAGMNLGDVKANWAYELGRFSAHPEAIAYGLENLPDQPPTVIQFRTICGSVPVRQSMPALPAPDQRGLQRIADTLRQALQDHDVKPVSQRALECLAALSEKVAAGTVGAAQRDFLRRAEAGLGLNQSQAIPGDFKPIDQAYWPEAMRAELAK